MTKKAAIYVRVSTRNQAKDGTGLQSQLQACNKKIIENGWEFYDLYQDKGVTGDNNIFLDGRDGIKRLFEDGEKGLFQIVVVYNTDRLGRSTKIYHIVMDKLVKELNLEVVSCTQDLMDVRKPDGKFTNDIRALIAEYDKAIVVKRLKMGRDYVARQRGENGGIITYGYKRDNKVVIVHPTESLIIKRIFKEKEEGMSLRKIADKLNQEGIKPRKSNKWYASSVKYVLDNKDKYMGGVRNNNINNVRWPRILPITEEEKRQKEELERLKNIKLPSLDSFR